MQRRRLRTELRRARSEANLTQEQVAQAMDWSLSKIIRIETGAAGISTNDLKALLSLYRIHDSDRTAKLMSDQAFEIYSKRLNELIDRLSQIGLGSKDVIKVVKALNDPEGDMSI